MTFQDRHVSGVIMEPHHIPAVRVSRPPFNCPPVLWPQAGCPNCHQKCLIIVLGGLLAQEVKLELSLWSALGQWTYSSGRAKNHCLVIHFDGYVLFCVLVVKYQFYLWAFNINAKKELLVLEVTSVRQIGAVAVTGFLQIRCHTQNHTITVTLYQFPLFQLNFI